MSSRRFDVIAGPKERSRVLGEIEANDRRAAEKVFASRNYPADARLVSIDDDDPGPPKKNPPPVALDKKALWREIEKDARDKRRTVLAELRDRLRAARDKRTTAIASAKDLCRTAKLDARARARQLEADAKAARAAARGTCDAGKAKATSARAEVVAARGARDAELAAQRDARRIDQIAKGSRKPLASTARERASESDDEVRANIPPELVKLFDRVRRQIKASPRKSRTEAFLEYAESHPSEVYDAIDDQTDALIAELQRREQEEYERAVSENPSGGLVELGAMTRVEYKPQGARSRVLRFALRTAPILAYAPSVATTPTAISRAKTRGALGQLVVVYPVKVAGKSSKAAAREYARTHWGKAGAGERIDGERALAPFAELGELVSVTYTTEKGGDAEPVDYEHEFGDGAKGAWTPPLLLEHRCRAPRCAHVGKVAIVGGTYRVTAHGIVG